MAKYKSSFEPKKVGGEMGKKEQNSRPTEANIKWKLGRLRGNVKNN